MQYPSPATLAYLHAARRRGLWRDHARDVRRELADRADAAGAAGAALDAWLWRAAFLAQAHPSAEVYARRHAHFCALSVAAVRAGERVEVERLLAVLHGGLGFEMPWAPPPRGARRDSHWEILNVETRNRLARLDQADDRATIGRGHNSQGNNR